MNVTHKTVRTTKKRVAISGIACARHVVYRT